MSRVGCKNAESCDIACLVRNVSGCTPLPM